MSSGRSFIQRETADEIPLSRTSLYDKRCAETAHARQGARAGEHLQDEEVRARNRRTKLRRRGLACRHAPRQSASLRRALIGTSLNSGPASQANVFLRRQQTGVEASRHPTLFESSKTKNSQLRTLACRQVQRRRNLNRQPATEAVAETVTPWQICSAIGLLNGNARITLNSDPSRFVSIGDELSCYAQKQVRDASLSQRVSNVRLKGKVVLLVDARIQQI